MTISVIIPAYNGAGTIANAIESILGQTRPPDEIIVSDDCSTDSTAAAVARFGERLRYMRRPQNGGLSANRNMGVRASGGEWLLFLDQDDELLPHALESLSRTAETTGAGVV
jgi:glycosyltransferase involved in cell wall biosynthesis